MAVEKPMTGVDLALDEPRVAVDPQTLGHGLRVGRRLEGVGEREWKEGVPDPCGDPVDFMHLRKESVERRRPVGIGELPEQRLEHEQSIGWSQPAATMPSDLTLRRPTADEEEEVLRAHRATSAEVPSFLHSYTEGMAFRRYLEVLAEQEQGINLPSPQHVRFTFLFAFVGTRVVGRVSIRHSLNAFLEREGGHIGYVVVPEFRRQGHATRMLRLALQVARDRCGLDRVLVTCDDDNTGSIRTIEKNGGRLENVVTAPGRGTPKRRYWFDLRRAGAADDRAGV